MRAPPKTVWLVIAGVVVGVMWACPCFGQSPLVRKPTGRLTPYSEPPTVQRLTASDAERNDFFGWTVAIDGDIAAVGAIQAEVEGVQFSGAVYIFKRTGGTWSQVQIITKPDAASSFYFGESITLRGEDLFIGVPTHTVSDLYGAGIVYVYRWDGDEFLLTQDLSMAEAVDGARFGLSIAVDGSTLVVGASGAGASSEGFAFVFENHDDQWEQSQVLVPYDWVPDNQFGATSALEGDWLIIGAPGDQLGHVWAAGSAYVYHHDGTSWNEYEKLTADDADFYDIFGSAIVLSDGTALIGALNNDHPDQDYAGSVYIYTESAGIWSEQAMFFSQNPTDGMNWGKALALSGNTAMIGFHSADYPELPSAGCVDFLTRSGGTWTRTQRLFSEHPATSGNFGFAVASTDSDLIIGALGEDAPDTWDAGAAYVMPLPQPRLTFSTNGKRAQNSENR